MFGWATAGIHMDVERQPELNIGLIGHVDHGKSTLAHVLTGERTDRHSEEIKRGISIRLGYADMNCYRCETCTGPEGYTNAPTCRACGGKTRFLRSVSFVDAPGHETLMATMLSGAAMMDAALLVIAANERCPQPQTKEHLLALEITGIKKIIIVQNKIDVVTREQARENYKDILELVKGTAAEGAPVIPLSAHHEANLDVLLMMIDEHMPTPERDIDSPSRMYVVRSFDVNRPGCRPQDLRGGVLGGSLIQGEIRVGDEIEIAPGQWIEDGGKRYHEPFRSVARHIFAGKVDFERIRPGGLVAIGTDLDPALTKSDMLAGKILGRPDTLPPVLEKVSMDVTLLERTVGTQKEMEVVKIRTGERPLFTIGSMTTVGEVTSARSDHIEAKLTIPVCGEVGQRVAVSRRITGKWRLIGYGILK